MRVGLYRCVDNGLLFKGFVEVIARNEHFFQHGADMRQVHPFVGSILQEFVDEGSVGNGRNRQGGEVFHGRGIEASTARAAARAASEVAEPAERHIQIPHYAAETLVVGTIQVVILGKSTDIGIEVDQQVVERQHPEGAVDIEDLVDCRGLGIQGVDQVEQVGPACVAFYFVCRLIQRGIGAEPFQGGVIAGAAGACTAFLRAGF